MPISLKGYCFEQTPTETSFGGALLYISNSIIYKPRNDLTLYEKGKIESVFIEVIVPKKSNLIVGCIYRHPNMSVSDFNDSHLISLLNKISSENKKIYLMGDYNIDLIKVDSDANISKYFNHLSSNHILPHINIPTRITDRSKTLIDNIFSNSITHNVSGNLTSSISDHMPQFLIFPSSEKISKCKRNTIYKRNYKNIDKESYCPILQMLIGTIH